MALQKLASGLLSLVLIVTVNVANAETSLGPDALVKETSQKVLTLLGEQKEQIQSDPAAVFKLVDEVVLPHFDFVLMSRLVLGKHWRKADKAQKKAFVLAFKELLVRTYATSLREYAGQSVNFLPFSATPNAKKAKVRTEVVGADGKAIAIDYGLRQSKTGWKVYDIVVEGLSLVTNYRSSFDSDVNNLGLNGLIEKLQAENAKQLEAKNSDG